MILTWVFRALFVPLLVLAIITSNCSAADAAAAACFDLAPVAGIPLADLLDFATRLGGSWWDMPPCWTATPPRSARSLLVDCL